MSKHHQPIDAYAETHILQPQVPHIASSDSGNLALYDEYARESARPAEPPVAAQPKRREAPRRKR